MYTIRGSTETIFFQLTAPRKDLTEHLALTVAPGYPRLLPFFESGFVLDREFLHIEAACASL